MTASRLVPLMLLALIALVSVGCNRPYDERNALMDQNREAQSEIDRLRAALDSAMTDLGALNGENARLQQENASLRSRPTPGPVANQPANTGFEGIDNVAVDRTANRITLSVASDILFASGKVDLQTRAKQSLNEVAKVLNSQYAGKTIHVIGHTDTDPIRRSGWDDNLQLSMERGAAVYRYLQERGIAPERMLAGGQGQTHPLGSKAASRRVEIVVILSGE